jgi:hypothetical protein
MLGVYRLQAMYFWQWDGKKVSAQRINAEIVTMAEAHGASVVSSHYEARLSALSPELLMTIERHDGTAAWHIEVARGEWLAIWTEGARIIAIDQYDERDGADRFTRVAPVHVLRPNVGTLES